MDRLKDRVLLPGPVAIWKNRVMDHYLSMPEDKQKLVVLFIALAALTMVLFAGGSVFQHVYRTNVTVSLQGADGVGSMSAGEKKEYARTLETMLIRNPETMGRMIGEEIKLVLDRPGLERREMPTVVWQYRSKSCVLDLFFRADKDGAADYSRVKHFEIRHRDIMPFNASYEAGKNVEADAQSSCLRSIIREHQNGDGQLVVASR